MFLRNVCLKLITGSGYFVKRYRMVEGFVAGHFDDTLFYGKVAVWMNGETERLFSLWVVHLIY